jgi:GGDEF domain-containing protein
MTLLRRWHDASLTWVWADAANRWWTSAVDAVVDALGNTSENADLRAAAADLGRQRAAAGVALENARADLQVAAKLVSSPAQVELDVLDALTVAWVAETREAGRRSQCVDPMTELASIDYLAARLDEIRAEAEAQGRTPSETHTLVVVRTSGTADPVERETRMITVQTALRNAFRGGEPLARLGPDCAAAVARRDPVPLREALAVLGRDLDIAVTEGRLPAPVRSELHPVPADHHALVRLLTDAG